MDLFSHVLWTRVATRNKLWDEEALLFALLPDIGFLLIMMYVIFGKPMGQDFTDAMVTLPPAFLIIYRLLHSFVTLGIVSLIVWKLRPKLLPALSAWAMHICMDIPFHGGALFGTRFLYPILPDFYFSGLSWGDYRVLAVSYFMLLIVWYYLEMRELKKHRNPGLKPDWLDRMKSGLERLAGPRPTPSATFQDQTRAGSNIHAKAMTPEQGLQHPADWLPDPNPPHPAPGTSKCPPETDNQTKDFG